MRWVFPMRGKAWTFGGCQVKTEEALKVKGVQGDRRRHRALTSDGPLGCWGFLAPPGRGAGGGEI